jgi:hypothetical protein
MLGLLLACRHDDLDRGTFIFEKPRVELSRKFDDGTTHVAGPGKVFATIELACRPDAKYDWLSAVASDGNGNEWGGKYASESRSSSGTQGLFGVTTTTDHPTRARITFEIPEGTKLTTVTAPVVVEL